MDLLRWGHLLNFMTLQVYLLINTTLNIDIYKMIIDPFMPPRLRVRQYKLYVLAITFGIFAY